MNVILYEFKATEIKTFMMHIQTNKKITINRWINVFKATWHLCRRMFFKKKKKIISKRINYDYKLEHSGCWFHFCFTLFWNGLFQMICNDELTFYYNLMLMQFKYRIRFIFQLLFKSLLSMLVSASFRFLRLPVIHVFNVSSFTKTRLILF